MRRCARWAAGYDVPRGLSATRTVRQPTKDTVGNNKDRQKIAGKSRYRAPFFRRAPTATYRRNKDGEPRRYIQKCG
jgi:hypothetical protein